LHIVICDLLVADLFSRDHYASTNGGDTTVDTNDGNFTEKILQMLSNPMLPGKMPLIYSPGLHAEDLNV